MFILKNKKRAISFDIGIKNLAFCIIDYCDNSINIIDWKCVNLAESEDDIVDSALASASCPRSCCFFTTKKSSAVVKPCKKRAFFQKETNLYCKKHIPEGLIEPKKEHSITHLKKQKITELLKICENEKIELPQEKQKKDAIVQIIYQHFYKKQITPIEIKKAQNCGKVSLINIGQNIKKELDKMSATIAGVSVVLIENQISTVASRMTSIQAMILQYFIMTIPNVEIHFISSKNKLANFVAPDGDGTNTSKKSSYKDNKKNGINYCNSIFDKEKEQIASSWKDFLFSNKKKDDLADCFLQGYYWIKLIK